MSAGQLLLGGLGFRGKEKEWAVTGGLGPSGLRVVTESTLNTLHHMYIPSTRVIMSYVTFASDS